MLITCATLTVALLSPVSVSPLRNFDGSVLRWATDDTEHEGPYLPLVGNPRGNSVGIDELTFARSVVTGLQTWSTATHGYLQFDYWQGTDSKIYPTAIKADGYSSIFFASQNPEQFGPQVPDNPLANGEAAYTHLWIAANGHEIIEIDLVLNDITYQFVSRSVPGAAVPKFLVHDNRVLVLEDTISHELGHAWGLDHSLPGNATMFPFGWYTQNATSCDDIAGIHELYLPDPGTQGAITGQLVDNTGRPVLGASVTAISALNPDYKVSALSDHNGHYRIPRLGPGEYHLLLEPVDPSAVTLSAYYNARVHQICTTANGFPTNFSRAFLQDARSPGRLMPITVVAGQDTPLQSWPVHCGFDAGMETPPVASAMIASAPEIWAGVHGQSQSGQLFSNWVDRFDHQHTKERWYDVSEFEGDLEIRVASHSLFSPAWVDLRLFYANGEPLQGTTIQSPLREATTHIPFVDYDASLSAQGLPRGDYKLRVKITPQTTDTLVNGAQLADQTPFYLLALRSGAGLPEYLNIERCAGDRSLWPNYEMPIGKPACSHCPEVSDDTDEPQYCNSRNRQGDDLLWIVRHLLGL